MKGYYSTYQNPDFIQLHKKDQARFPYLIFLGMILIVSALLSMILHVQIFMSAHYILKIPVFAVLGISVTFALGVSMIDLINFIQGICTKDSYTAINSSKQIIPIIFFSCLMGCLFGVVFGIMDVEDTTLAFLRNALKNEVHYCAPIGVILGGLTGYYVAMSDNFESTDSRGDFKPLKQEEEIEI